MKLYVVTYFGLDKHGDEIFQIPSYYTDSQKAKERILDLANNVYKRTLGTYLYPSRMDVYTQLKILAEIDGELKLMRHGIVSYSDGEEEESLADRKVVINTDSELFKSL